MKQLLVLTNNIGGLHSFRKEVMKAFVDAGYEVCISAPDKDPRSSYFEQIGCKVIHTTFQRRSMNPIGDLRLLWKYGKLIWRIKPNAVLTYTIKPNIYGGIACRLLNVPQVANITGLGDSIENGGWLQKLTLALYRIGLGKARTVFFQNQRNKEFIVSRHITRGENILLPGSGVNLEHHTLQPYPQDENIVKFLFIARLLKDKGTEEYFETAKNIKRKYPHTEFQILGACEGKYQEELDLLVGQGIINYLGTTTDVRPYIGNAHCTVMPSYHEGMSNVNLESAANGRPIITTNIPGCRETVDDNVTGLLANPRDTADLTDKVEKFIRLPYTQKKEMGLAGRKKIEREFNRQLVIERYLNAVQSL